VLAIEDGKCYGWGSFNRGQLAQKPTKGKKIQLTPKLIPLPGKVQSVTAGSLFSTALL
jgi:alpha-tubulin suppressor-like RCC1 family protein